MAEVPHLHVADEKEMVWERAKYGTESGRTMPQSTAKLSRDNFVGLVV
jgi:hypothetical protein